KPLGDLARPVLRCGSMSQDNDGNQGEGDRKAARRYDHHARESVAEGKVPDAASEANAYVEREAAEASRAERWARRGAYGSRSASVDELVAKGHTILDRVRPFVDRTVGRLRARLARK